MTTEGQLELYRVRVIRLDTREQRELRTTARSGATAKQNCISRAADFWGIPHDQVDWMWYQPILGVKKSNAQGAPK